MVIFILHKFVEPPWCWKRPMILSLNILVRRLYTSHSNQMRQVASYGLSDIMHYASRTPPVYKTRVSNLLKSIRAIY
jgi:hypothetical protein